MLYCPITALKRYVCLYKGPASSADILHTASLCAMVPVPAQPAQERSESCCSLESLEWKLLLGTVAVTTVATILLFTFLICSSFASSEAVLLVFPWTDRPAAGQATRQCRTINCSLYDFAAFVYPSTCIYKNDIHFSPFFLIFHFLSLPRLYHQYHRPRRRRWGKDWLGAASLSGSRTIA